MIENMTKRLSGILNRYKLPIALQVSINKTITDEICKLCAETADTVRMIDLWTLLDGMGFSQEQVEEFAQKAQENYSDAYGTYGLDAVLKLRQILAERGIKYAAKNNEWHVVNNLFTIRFSKKLFTFKKVYDIMESENNNFWGKMLWKQK